MMVDSTILENCGWTGDARESASCLAMAVRNLTAKIDHPKWIKSKVDHSEHTATPHWDR